MRHLFLCAGLLLLAGCDWEDFGSSTQYSTDFHYSYPLKPGGRISLDNFNGWVEVENIKGDCTVKTSNGRVEAQRVEGALDATTSNGSVDAAVDEVRPGGVRVSTSNGGITVRLARAVNARLMARTSNASISTDFDLSTHGVRDKHHLEGTIGAGGPVIDLSTSNGGIHVVR